MIWWCYLQRSSSSRGTEDCFQLWTEIYLFFLTPAKAACWQGSFIYSYFVPWNVLEDSKSVRVKYLISSSDFVALLLVRNGRIHSLCHSHQATLLSNSGHSSFSLPRKERSGPWPWQRGTEQECELWRTASHPPPQPLALSQPQTQTRANPGGTDRLNLEKQHAVRYNGAPGAWDLVWQLQMTALHLPVPIQAIVALPSPGQGASSFPFSQPSVPLFLHRRMSWTGTEGSLPSPPLFAWQRHFSSANTRESAAPKKWTHFFFQQPVAPNEIFQLLVPCGMENSNNAF